MSVQQGKGANGDAKTFSGEPGALPAVSEVPAEESSYQDAQKPCMTPPSNAALSAETAELTMAALAEAEKTAMAAEQDNMMALGPVQEPMLSFGARKRNIDEVEATQNAHEVGAMVFEQDGGPNSTNLCTDSIFRFVFGVCLAREHQGTKSIHARR